MSLIVQKFGGTSVADTEKIMAAARKAIRAQQQGHRVVVVVSAMGHNTDQLIELARQIHDSPPAREMDMLLSTGEQVSVALMAMAVHALGSQAISLTGAQIGIRTDSTHTKARIRSISTERLRKALDQGNIVIAAGFQGIDEDFNITTLGRGGSDTTAVALAAVLGADQCEIYTDVDGVYTTDPRMLPEARKVDRISYDEMLELASLGAGVMHSRSVEFGKKFNVPIHVRSSFADVPGTLIVAQPESRVRPVCGAACVKNEARVTLRGLPDRPGMSLGLFSRIAKKNIAVDMIVQNVGEHGRADVSFTVLRDELPQTLAAVRDACEALGAEGYSYDEEAAKVSVVGLGMATQTGVAQRMFRALADAGVNLQMITTSEIKISVLVERQQALTALRAAHQAFQLDQPPEDACQDGDGGLPHPAARNAVDIVRRLQRMEDLAIDELRLDDSQALVTLRHVPDRPGVAATVFEHVAHAGILVDMIVQSSGAQERADLSFTIPRADLPRCLTALQSVTSLLGAGQVTSAQEVAKLSVSGIGMRSHTGVAMRMFESLAAEGINVELISTSEVRVNVVVDSRLGQRALECLRTAFADAMI
jgi:aspartate kinase